MNVTTQRPPYTPEKFGHMAGRVFEPERRTAMHHRHLELGAQMMPAGLWWRPAYYGKPADRETAIRDEVHERAQQCRADRRLDPRRARCARAGCGRVPEPHVHLRLRQAAGRPLALRADDRPGRRRHRRRRRLPLPRRAFLRHRDHQRRRCRLSPDAVLERAVAPQCRRRQRHRRLCRRQHRRAALARSAAEASAAILDLSPGGLPLSRRPRWRRSPAFPPRCCASASSASSATRSTCPRMSASLSGTR